VYTPPARATDEAADSASTLMTDVAISTSWTLCRGIGDRKDVLLDISPEARQILSAAPT
jgi:hypothetical protein